MNEHPSNSSTFQEQMYYKRVLLIEDDNRIANFIQRGLKAEGYAVEVAVTGQEGLLLATEGQFQTIILDLGLPDIDGQKICEYLRAKRIDTPILMLTAREGINDKITGLRGGADDYMTKPFVFEELLARLRALMRRAKPDDVPDGNEPVQIADLRLDPTSRRVWRGQREVELSKTEFDLLELLVRNQGIVLEHSTIYDRIWGYDFGGESNIIEVYIRYLRSKLEEGGEPRLIQTVRGVGYALREE